MSIWQYLEDHPSAQLTVMHRDELPDSLAHGANYQPWVAVLYPNLDSYFSSSAASPLKALVELEANIQEYLSTT